MRNVATFFLVAISLFSTPKLWAWGCQGHQSIALIAQQNLNVNAFKNLSDLLSNAQSQYTSATGETLRRFCAQTSLGQIAFFATWADDARDDSNAGWHFWDIPLAADSAAMPNYCGDEGCVISALKDQISILSTSTDRNQKQRALLFVIHLVGDLHQPMHIIDNGDRGGNCVPLTFNYPGYKQTTKASQGGSYEPNLHSIWDTNMIAVYSGRNKSTLSDTATTNWVQSISSAHKADIKAAAQKAFDISDDEATLAEWAVATHKLASADSYSRLPTPIPVDPHPTTLASCTGVSEQFSGLDEEVDKAFVDNNQSVIEGQIALAGGRLASILNTIWPGPPRSVLPQTKSRASHKS